MATEREIRYKFSATENVTSVAGRVHKSLKAMRKSEGAEALEEIAKLGRGAGALVVLEMLGSGLEKVTETMKNLRAESLKMKLTLGDTLDAFARDIPIYGKIWAAGRALHDELPWTDPKDQAKNIEKMQRRTEGDRLISETKRKTEDIRETYRALQKRTIGQDLAANLIEIKAEREKTVGAIREQLDKDTAATNNPGQRAQLRRQAAEQSLIADRTRAAKEIQAIEADRAAKAQKTFSFADKGVDFLKQEAELGKVGTGYLAAKLQLTNEYAKKQEEIGVLLKKDNLTQQETNALRATQAGLGQQEKEAIARLRVGDVQFSGGLSPTEQSSFLTGVGAAGRENNPALKIVTNTDLAAKRLFDIYNLMLKQQTPAGVGAYTVK